jgi:cyclase
MRKHAISKNLFFVFVVLSLSTGSLCWLFQETPSLTIEKVSDDVYCLYGAGGNIGILKGKDGLLIVDASYARTANDVKAKLGEFCAQKIQYLVNTHYHGDHAGGNPILGRDAQIISQKNCKTSMMKTLKPEETPESIGVPQLTFEREMSLRLGDEIVKLAYFGPGHTSGDTVVIFEKARVIHAGDLFFHGMPPYIDVGDGSDTKNWVSIIEQLGEKYPDYQVIPGHGTAATMKEFLRFADYLKRLRGEVAAAIEAGKTREQAQDSIDLSEFSDIQNQGQFLTKKENIGWVYDEMTREKK